MDYKTIIPHLSGDTPDRGLRVPALATMYMNAQGTFCTTKPSTKIAASTIVHPVELPTRCPLDIIFESAGFDSSKWRTVVRLVEVKFGISTYFKGEQTLEFIRSTYGIPEAEVVVDDRFTNGEPKLVGLYMPDGNRIASRSAYFDSKKKQVVWKKAQLDTFGCSASAVFIGRMYERTLELLKKNGFGTWCVFPAHPNWIWTEEVTRVNMLIVPETVASGSFFQTVFDRMGWKDPTLRITYRQRMAKDVLNEYIGETFTMRLRVEDMGKNHDGDTVVFNCSSIREGTRSLFKGIARYNGAVVIAKGSMVHLPEVAVCNQVRHGELLNPINTPENELIHGQISLESIKGPAVPVGTVLEFVCGCTKEEYHEAASNGYRSSLTSVFCMESEPAHSAKIFNRRFKGTAQNKASIFENLEARLTERLESGFANESEKEEIGKMNGYIVKAFLNLLPATNADVLVSQAKEMHKFASTRSPETAYMPVVFADRISYIPVGANTITTVELGENDVVLSAETRAKLPGTSFTAWRDPIVGKESFQRLSIRDEYVPEMLGDFAIASTKLAELLQGDGDDHMKGDAFLVSALTPATTEPVVSRKQPEVNQAEVTNATAVVWGAVSQKGTGGAANNLHMMTCWMWTAREFFKTYPSEAHLTALTKLFEECRTTLGGCLQAHVQGIKKPVRPELTFTQGRAMAKDFVESVLFYMTRTAAVYELSVEEVKTYVERAENMWAVYKKPNKAQYVARTSYAKSEEEQARFKKEEESRLLEVLRERACACEELLGVSVPYMLRNKPTMIPVGKVEEAREVVANVYNEFVVNATSSMKLFNATLCTRLLEFYKIELETTTAAELAPLVKTYYNVMMYMPMKIAKYTKELATATSEEAKHYNRMIRSCTNAIEKADGLLLWWGYLLNSGKNPSPKPEILSEVHETNE